MVGLKALTVYSQLLGGTTPASREDALGFMRFQTEIKELHLLDVFAPSGFISDLAKALSPSLKFLEVNYTYRHSDPQFLFSTPSADLGSLIDKGLVGLTFSISAPDVTDDEEDREGTEVGVVPISGKDARTVVERLVQEGERLVICDVTMFELTLPDVERLLDSLGDLKVFNFAVALDKGWEEVFEVLAKKNRNVEVVEIVGVPGEGMVEGLKDSRSLLAREMLESLSLTGKCEALKSVKISVLRTRVEQWIRDGKVWEKKT